MTVAFICVPQQMTFSQFRKRAHSALVGKSLTVSDPGEYYSRVLNPLIEFSALDP